VYSYFIRLEGNPTQLGVHVPGRIDLARVPKNRILDRTAYEFFAGLGGQGQPTWTSDLAERRPVFEDANGVGWVVSVSYNAPLGRYLLATEHTRTTQGRLGLFDAPEPWGPWTTVSYAEEGAPFGAGHIDGSTFFWNFSNKWLGAGGRPLVLVFTGIGSNDAWNTVEGRFTLAEPAPVVLGIAWDDPAAIRSAAKGSDNWPITWGDDDLLYTAYGDGWGFDPRVPQKLSLGFASVSGGPADFAGTNIHPTNGDQTGDGRRGKKASGMLMVDGVLYAWLRNAGGDGTKAQLIWSEDHGQSWTFAPWLFDEFGYPCLVNFGKNYAGARDEYVYTLTPDTPDAYRETDDAALMRVPRDRIREREAYEFFTGLDPAGDPQWSPDVARRGSALHFPGGVNRLDVTYNRPLKRYLMTQRSRAEAGGLDQFSLFEAPEPWGPWTRFFYTEDWDVDPGENQHIPSKWISADGLVIHLVFSGDDSFRVRKGTLRVVGDRDGDGVHDGEDGCPDDEHKAEPGHCGCGVPEGPCLFLRGDGNVDGRPDIGDAIFTLQYLFAHGQTPLCAKSIDCDDSGSIDIADAVYLLQYLFARGQGPPQPFGNCGLDPTPDVTPCASYPPCA
jgi:hypothetical protein